VTIGSSKQKLIILLLLLLITIWHYSNCTAQNDTGTYSPNPGGIYFWLLIICYFTRKKPIGGWFLYYLMILGLGVLIALIDFIQNIPYFDPSYWESTATYTSWLLTIMPMKILLVWEATILLPGSRENRRKWQIILLIRKIISIQLVTLIFLLIYDYYMWPEFILLDLIPLVQTPIWLAYFYKSKRVKNIFGYQAYIKTEASDPYEDLYDDSTTHDKFDYGSEETYEEEDNEAEDPEEERVDHEQNEVDPESEKARYFGRVLNLKGKITRSDIREAYRVLIKQYHPDRVHGLGPEFKKIAEEKTKEINRAYEYFKERYGL